MRNIATTVTGRSWTRGCGIVAWAIVALCCGAAALAADRQAGSSDAL